MVHQKKSLIHLDIAHLEKKIKGCRFSYSNDKKGNYNYFFDIPNQYRKIVRLENMLSSPEYSNSKAILPMCIGANLSGVPVVADLESAPHILIAGNSLSGKSTVIYSMLVSMLLKKSSDQLRLVLAGSNKICFSEFEGLPHLLTPILRDRDELLNIFAWLKAGQERRYKIFLCLDNLEFRNLTSLLGMRKIMAKKYIYLSQTVKKKQQNWRFYLT